MEETIGTLNLKIARLQQRLRILQQQQLMSSPYPDRYAGLVREGMQTQGQLRELVQYREELIHNVAKVINVGGTFNGDGYEQKQICAVN